MSTSPVPFTPTPARPLPVILLLDCSGSMKGEKIEALNAAVRELSGEMASARQPQGEVYLCAIRFAQAVEVGPLLPAAQWTWTAATAGGATAMGGALDALRTLLADREKVPSNSFAPTVVLVSDGQPTDDFDGALAHLMELPRMSKVVRLALAIGEDADEAVLKRFVGNPEIPVVRARDTARIRDFFTWVSLSVHVRTRSRMPDEAPVVAPHLAHIPDHDLVY